MKKIIILFLLVSSILFGDSLGEFIKEVDGFTINMTCKYYFSHLKPAFCILRAFEGNKEKKTSMILLFNQKVSSITFDDSFITFKDYKLDFSLVGNYTYSNKNTTNVMIKGHSISGFDEFYITIENMRWLKYFFKFKKDATFTVNTGEDSYYFDLSKYKDDIINSKFYKKIME